MNVSYLHPRDELLALMERIYRYRMTTTSGGNLSIREENGDIWITPARVDKGGLRREDIVRVRPDGSSEGDRLPSSELPFHQAIYRARPDVHGIVHAHPVALVAFSMVHQVPDTHLFHQARHVCGTAGFAPYELPGSERLGQSVAGTFSQGYDCVILENHGVVTAGADLQQAFHRFETLEFTAKIIVKARHLGEIRFLTNEEIELPGRMQTPMPAFQRGAPGSEEKETRRKLAEFVRRAYRQRLFISTQGSFSARLDGDSFLITPYQYDRGTIMPEDLVLVSRGNAESAKRASRAAPVHAAVYGRYPEFRSIINAYPVNATAFSVTNLELDTRTIPESYVVVRRVQRTPYGLHFSDPNAIADWISPRQPALVLSNDGVLTAGGSILEAFDRLEVLESTAEALINCRMAGTLSPISDQAIRELEAAFLGG